MGAVERVFDRVLLRTVAMKTLLSTTLAPEADRFVEEAQITGQLDHPNIVPVYEFGAEAERAFFTMKLVSGRTLGELIRELHEQDFPAERLEALVAALVKVSEAVAFAHSRGVIHRDLKPANVMVGSHGQVYVMDWGLGLLRSAQGTETAVCTASQPESLTGRVEGTVAYMAPEQARGHLDAVDERSDVYALGAILYEILTDRPPHVGRDFAACLAAAALGEIRPPQDLSLHLLPPGLCEIALRALDPDPARRHPSAEAFGSELSSFLRGGGWFGTLYVDDGEFVVREGEAADSAFVIVEGRCEVLQERDGRRTVLRTLGPGDAFGETALLSARPRTASVVAVGSAKLKVVTAAAFYRELGRSAWLGALMEQLANRFVELDGARGRDESGP
jgi:serine/threonine-protein kinase